MMVLLAFFFGSALALDFGSGSGSWDFLRLPYMYVADAYLHMLDM